MPPHDSTPLGDAMTHRFANQKIPGTKPGTREAPAARPVDISERPELPDHPERTAADIEDEEADPVVDSGPGIAEGVGPKKQRG